MNERIQRLMKRLVTGEYPICIGKARLVMEASCPASCRLRCAVSLNHLALPLKLVDEISYF